ncbi:uncharacterized protein LOC131299575 [Rhododendron vialii]|uniref:uncharacterized protein LOC131299575 n=1 Tax=Rhododendron vialii TaxID=182163 RepID=UPI0026604221|nr:uncharacterized protein LOC131299575 [Rhododendron vialii]
MSSHVENMNFLRGLWLANDSSSGEHPLELCHSRRLERFSVAINSITEFKIFEILNRTYILSLLRLTHKPRSPSSPLFSISHSPFDAPPPTAPPKLPPPPPTHHHHDLLSSLPSISHNLLSTHHHRRTPQTRPFRHHHLFSLAGDYSVGSPSGLSPSSSSSQAHFRPWPPYPPPLLASPPSPVSGAWSSTWTEPQLSPSSISRQCTGPCSAKRSIWPSNRGTLLWELIYCITSRIGALISNIELMNNFSIQGCFSIGGCFLSAL